MTPEQERGERYKVIATRLAAARRHAGMNQIEVAKRVGQKNMTQVSLWETGDRLPKLFDLIEMAQIYSVPMDYLCGLSDDWMADAPENNQAFLANVICKAIMTNHTSWASSTAQVISATLAGNSQDRSDLLQVAKAMNEAREAFDTFVKRNPDFDDYPGGAQLVSRFKTAERMINMASSRISDEVRQRGMMDAEIGVASGQFTARAERDVSVSVNQQLLDLTNG